MYKKINNDENPHFFMSKNSAALTSVVTLKDEYGKEQRIYVDDKFYRIVSKKMDGYFTIINLSRISPEIHAALLELPILNETIKGNKKTYPCGISCDCLEAKDKNNEEDALTFLRSDFMKYKLYKV
jgi:hypothetical protein